ncbi:expressed unknown protein [Seminavis robusta]|uniref:Uncharacterized protein n=1 Tax=Seminavis robusta TaxID=568900 RepID=A0A9N8HQ59_9STRA|nr:expressed unknown protein [Seminavis robusta]|eukprot:Sro1253_g256320.1 n/a (168) ;mRNA; f:3629-4132
MNTGTFLRSLLLTRTQSGSFRNLSFRICPDNAKGVSFLAAASSPEVASLDFSEQRWQETTSQKSSQKALAPPSPPYRRTCSNEEVAITRWRANRNISDQRLPMSDQSTSHSSISLPPTRPFRRGNSLKDLNVQGAADDQEQEPCLIPVTKTERRPRRSLINREAAAA